MKLLSYYLYKGVLYDTETLEHWGVLGMKWGARRYQNPDGTLTPAGRNRLAKQIGQDYRKNTRAEGYRSVYNAAGTAKQAINSIYSKDSIQAAKNRVLESNKLEREYRSDESLVAKYKEKAAEESAKRYGLDLEEAKYGYLYGDLDQGYGNSFQLYLKDKNVNVREYENERYTAYREYIKECKKATNELLEKYGSTTVQDPVYKKIRRSASDIVVRSLDDRLLYDEGGLSWYEAYD